MPFHSSTRNYTKSYMNRLLGCADAESRMLYFSLVFGVSRDSRRDQYTFSHALRTLSHRYSKDCWYPLRARLRASPSSRSSRPIFLPKACQSPISQRSPVRSCSTRSGIPPAEVVTTGRPEAKHSRIEPGMLSTWDALTKISALA